MQRLVSRPIHCCVGNISTSQRSRATALRTSAETLTLCARPCSTRAALRPRVSTVTKSWDVVSRGKPPVSALPSVFIFSSNRRDRRDELGRRLSARRVACSTVKHANSGKLSDAFNNRLERSAIVSCSAILPVDVRRGRRDPMRRISAKNRRAHGEVGQSDPLLLLLPLRNVRDTLPQCGHLGSGRPVIGLGRMRHDGLKPRAERVSLATKDRVRCAGGRSAGAATRVWPAVSNAATADRVIATPPATNAFTCSGCWSRSLLSS